MWISTPNKGSRGIYQQDNPVDNQPQPQKLINKINNQFLPTNLLTLFKQLINKIIFTQKRAIAKILPNRSKKQKQERFSKKTETINLFSKLLQFRKHFSKRRG